MTPTTAVALWLHDRVCAGFNNPRRYCTGDGRKRHARTQTARARRLVAATTLRDLATLVHDGICPMQMQTAHGGPYVDMRDRACGPDGSAHVDHLATHPAIAELWTLAGHSTEETPCSTSTAA